MLQDGAGSRAGEVLVASYTLRQLKYFVTTVEAGSVAEASRQLYIAQPSISTAIKGLEESQITVDFAYDGATGRKLCERNDYNVIVQTSFCLE